MLNPGATTMDTGDVSARDRIPFWNDWINHLFQGLKSDLYGDTDFDGRLASAQAGDVILTRLESNRHREESFLRRLRRLRHEPLLDRDSDLAVQALRRDVARLPQVAEP